MSERVGKIATVAIAATLAVSGGVVLGHASVDIGSARASGYRSGLDQGYFKGLPAGEAQGRREGRANQEGIALKPTDRQAVQHAFNDGYAAGANDAFAGYDGGWTLSLPYVVVLERSTGDITYRIGSRVPLESGVSYYLCAAGHELCQKPLR